MTHCPKHISKHHRSKSHSKRPDCHREKGVCDIKIREVAPVPVQVRCEKKLKFHVQFKKKIKLKQIKCVPHEIHERSLSGSTCDETTAYCDATGTLCMKEDFVEHISGKVETKLFEPKCIPKSRKHKC